MAPVRSPAHHQRSYVENRGATVENLSKNDLRAGRNPAPYENRDGGLPATAAGQAYYEHQVGAHLGDPRPRGKRRLVALLDAGRNVLKIYFTDAHYTKGEWKQLQFP